MSSTTPLPVKTPKATERDETTPSRNGVREPKLPHERDQSTDTRGQQPDARIQQGHDDVEAGLVDTDKGPVMDELHRKLGGPVVKKPGA